MLKWILDKGCRFEIHRGIWVFVPGQCDHVRLCEGCGTQIIKKDSLGTSTPSVAGKIRRLQKHGLVQLDTTKRIQLTNAGLKLGEAMARRHRLAEWFVVRLVGMELHMAHKEAHGLEHGMSPAFQERLTDVLGYPNRSPFGRPIPGTSQPEKHSDRVTLDLASANETYVVDRVPEDDIDLLRYLVDNRVIPDEEITVLEAAPFLGVMKIASPTVQVSLGFDVARKILVRTPE